MTSSFKEIKFKFLEFFPLFLLLFISLTGSAVMDFKIFSINVHYILIYYWVLKKPQALGYGFIFLSGIITDVMFGFPMGLTALVLLVVAAFAAYVRVVTVRVSLFSDWMAFIPALLIANLVYFFILYLSDYSIDYFYLIKNSIFTFIFYPILWIFFEILIRITKPGAYA